MSIANLEVLEILWCPILCFVPGIEAEGRERVLTVWVQVLG